MKKLLVTPFVGVWIETLKQNGGIFESEVTPFVGVWIETRMPCGSPLVLQSHPSWVCGLKQKTDFIF